MEVLEQCQDSDHLEQRQAQDSSLLLAASAFVSVPKFLVADAKTDDGVLAMAAAGSALAGFASS